jgi:hypothetical protein
MNRDERAGKNEALFREVNERIKELSLSQISDWSDVLCECSSRGCTKVIQVTIGEYEAVRAAGTRFAVSPGHEDPSLERVVDRTDRFFVVEKLGAAGVEAEKLDPRQ